MVGNAEYLNKLQLNSKNASYDNLLDDSRLTKLISDISFSRDTQPSKISYIAG